MEKTIIVGYANTFHDPALAFISGENVFAEALERSTQDKRARWKAGIGYTPDALRKVLAEASIPLASDVKLCIRTTWNFSLLEKLFLFGLEIFWRFFPIYRPMMPGIPMELGALGKVSAFSVNWFRRAVPLFVEQLAHAASGGRAKIVKVEPIRHHLTHASNAVFTSTFEECVAMVLDGQGERYGASFYHFKNGDFRSLGNCSSSLGFLYGRVTTLCGFSPVKGEEWKVMGLAAYGKLDQRVYKFFSDRTKVEGLQFHLDFPNSCWAELKEILGQFRPEDSKDPMEAADLAFTFQQYFSDLVVQISKNLFSLGLSENLAYAGGCALNSLANGRLVGESGFKRLHIPSAPADDGNALGAALYEAHVVRKQPRSLKVGSPFLGAKPDLRLLESILSFGHLRHTKFTDTAQQLDYCAELLANGKILGWMQGRAEYGPRALGNRSILADPRKIEMKDEINRLVKFREKYRPIAPSILHEYGNEYFEQYQFSPYMERAILFKDQVKEKVAAVVHEDGTGRLQSVTKELNPLYYDLIHRFREKTGIPILVNTSLNVMGRPIVHGVEDALTLFATTGLHVLSVGPYVIEKN